MFHHLSVNHSLSTTVLVLFKDFYLLAWTCIWQDEQASKRLVPSSPMWELVGGGSELQAPTLKHISGISGRVRLTCRGRGEKRMPEEVPSFDGYRHREKEDRTQWQQVFLLQTRINTQNKYQELPISFYMCVTWTIFYQHDSTLRKNSRMK